MPASRFHGGAFDIFGKSGFQNETHEPRRVKIRVCQQAHWSGEILKNRDLPSLSRIQECRSKCKRDSIGFNLKKSNFQTWTRKTLCTQTPRGNEECASACGGRFAQNWGSPNFGNPSTWAPAHGPQHMDPSTWVLAHGPSTWAPAHRPQHIGPSTWAPAHPAPLAPV